MKFLSSHRRFIVLIAILLPVSALFAYSALRSGPLAPVTVTTTIVERRSIMPALFGIGTVEARYTHRIGPTAAGRLKQVGVDVGTQVRAGQLLGEMDPVDLDEKILAQSEAHKRAEAALVAAEARFRDVSARKTFTEAQLKRYEELFSQKVISSEVVETKRQDNKVADAALMASKADIDGSRRDIARLEAEIKGLNRQRSNLYLTSPVDGLVISREIEPGSTVTAGQSVLEIINPNLLWINVRFDQAGTAGLKAGLKAIIVLRSRLGVEMPGEVFRVEPRADAITEETLAKVVFDPLPENLPPIGELAEVTVLSAALPETLVIPNASVQRQGRDIGVWVIEAGGLRFAPVRMGLRDLDGRIQIVDGVKADERIVVHSRRPLSARSRIEIVSHLLEGTP